MSATDDFPRMDDGTEELRRYMTPEMIEDREILNRENTAEKIALRAAEERAKQNGAVPR